MKQRFYLDKAYAKILSEKAAAVGVEVDLYLHHLITQDFICGGSPRGVKPSEVFPSAETDEVSLAGNWSGLSL